MRRIRRILTTASGVVLVLAMQAPPAEAGSIFVEIVGSSEGTYASAAKTQMTAMPQQTSSQQTPYFAFIATRLADGSFFQAGWQDNMPDRCNGARSYFAYAQNPDNTMQFWDSKCSVTLTTHVFEIILAYNYGTYMMWDARVDGVPLGPNYFFTGPGGHDTGPSYQPYVQTELPAGTNPAYVNMPRIHFGPTIKWRFGATYYSPTHGKTRGSTESQFQPVCQWRYYYTGDKITSPTFNHSLAGDGVLGSESCKPDGYQIW